MPKYCFTFVDIGAAGSGNDASVMSNCQFGQTFEHALHTMNLPEPGLIGNKIIPYFLIADDIFALKPWLMKPFAGRNLSVQQRVFNYRLSRARRTIENAFGIVAAKWRILRQPIKGSVELVEMVTKAVVCLHNYLRLTANASYLPTGFVDCEDGSGNIILGDWRSAAGLNQALRDLPQLAGNRHSFNAGVLRDEPKDYVNSADLLTWQLDHVNDCGRIVNQQQAE